MASLTDDNEAGGNLDKRNIWFIRKGFIDMNVKDATAKRIELLCKERGITYNSLSNICGLTPSTVYSIFDPKRRCISLSTVKKICDGLEMTLGEFFSHSIFESLEQEIQ